MDDDTPDCADAEYNPCMRSVTVATTTVYVSDEVAAQLRQLDILYRAFGHVGDVEIPAHTDTARDVLVALPIGGEPLVFAPHDDVDPADPDGLLGLIAHEVLELRADLTETIESTEMRIDTLPDDDPDVIAGMNKLAALREREHEVEDLQAGE